MGDRIPAQGPHRPANETGEEALTVRDALMVLAIRMMGGDIRRNPSARQHIIALARATPLFQVEGYDQTAARLGRFLGRAGTTAMDAVFARALDQLKGACPREALAWSARNAVAQQPTDEKTAMLHHIGKALGFSASEVAQSLAQAQRKPAGYGAAQK